MPFLLTAKSLYANSGNAKSLHANGRNAFLPHAFLPTCLFSNCPITDQPKLKSDKKKSLLPPIIQCLSIEKLFFLISYDFFVTYN